MVKSWGFEDDESKSESITNSGPRMCSLLIEGPHFACVEHAQCPPLAHFVSAHTHAHTPTHTHTHTFLNFFIQICRTFPWDYLKISSTLIN